jgi:hypothetical protein
VVHIDRVFLLAAPSEDVGQARVTKTASGDAGDLFELRSLAL